MRNVYESPVMTYTFLISCSPTPLRDVKAESDAEVHRTLLVALWVNRLDIDQSAMPPPPPFVFALTARCSKPPLMKASWNTQNSWDQDDSASRWWCSSLWDGRVASVWWNHRIGSFERYNSIVFSGERHTAGLRPYSCFSSPVTPQGGLHLIEAQLTEWQGYPNGTESRIYDRA